MNPLISFHLKSNLIFDWTDQNSKPNKHKKKLQLRWNFKFQIPSMPLILLDRFGRVEFVVVLFIVHVINLASILIRSFSIYRNWLRHEQRFRFVRNTVGDHFVWQSCLILKQLLNLNRHVFIDDQFLRDRRWKPFHGHSDLLHPRLFLLLLFVATFVHDSTPVRILSPGFPWFLAVILRRLVLGRLLIVLGRLLRISVNGGWWVRMFEVFHYHLLRVRIRVSAVLNLIWIRRLDVDRLNERFVPYLLSLWLCFMLQIRSVFQPVGFDLDELRLFVLQLLRLCLRLLAGFLPRPKLIQDAEKFPIDL